MYELIQVGAHSYYIQSPAKIGLYQLNEREVCLIDSGNDKEAGRKVLRLLEAQNWHLSAIINTHSNADHIGGNHYLSEKTGCPIFASGIEQAFTCHPILEPAFLYGGYPCQELRHKFLLAKPSPALPITDSAFPEALEILPLAGHFFDMIGLRTPDQVVYLADCLSSEATLAKYRISFIYDVAQYLATLTSIEQLEASLFIPAHAEPTADIRPLAQRNREQVLEIIDRILLYCHTPHTFEEVLTYLFTTYQLTMDFAQYALVGSTVRSYLSYLYDQKRLQADFDHNRLLWSSLV